jgi:hypothetical protein
MKTNVCTKNGNGAVRALKVKNTRFEGFQMIASFYYQCLLQIQTVNDYRGTRPKNLRFYFNNLVVVENIS